ncbi:conserved hypothetical protein [Thioalkalivibrio sulfidiphilus HL-EbGr7]|uniref:Uncharacterized protein n=2 Tax=Thioalkalivibrio TaxID=106633 RepID=B8GUW8_THISH|nr:conserved hypothetical protein [Thioalkalivibrio sulfidiphilus HL-EbGr7]
MATDKRLIEDLNSLVDIRPDRKLPETPMRGPLAPGRGYAAGDEPPTTQGGGIASPLIEPDISAREYYESRLFTSSDGIFTLEVAPIRQLLMADANGAEVVFQFAEPEP